MVCQHPINLELGKPVPCGRCVPCRMARASEWSLRLMHELESWEKSAFITLTYAPKYCDDMLHKKHLVDFFKRLRFSLADRKIKYFAAGEYGERFGRPHYHAIIFGIDEKDRKIVEDAWSMGFVDIGSVEPESIRYVTSYIVDKEASIALTQFEKVRQKPFQLQSKGLGKDWLLNNFNKVLVDGEIKFRGSSRSVPRYYVKLLGENITDEMADIRTAIRHEEKQVKLAKYGIDELGRADYERQLRNQKICERKFNNERRKDGKKL